MENAEIVLSCDRRMKVEVVGSVPAATKIFFHFGGILYFVIVQCEK